MDGREDKGLGNQDGKEKERELSEAEKRRLAAFEQLSEEMRADGWRDTELTVSIVKANAFAVALLVPLFAVGFGVSIIKNGGVQMMSSLSSMLLFFAAVFIMIPVHELLHGLGWARYTKRGFKDIEFGFMKQYLTPYCTCSVPLSRGAYIFGALLPLAVLGLLPFITGMMTGSGLLLLLGIIMTDSAAGDIMIVRNIRRYKSGASETVYVDHPTQAGVVVFER